MNIDSGESISEIRPEAVQEQLGRMLAHPVFKASRRCQLLLPRLVEHSLLSDGGHLKERTLGVEVFGRSPDYDTNDDPVVRNTCSDIRKRIAQYYHDPQHETELRIDLPLGSYLLDFHLPELQATEIPIRKKLRRYPVLIVGIAVVVLCTIVFFKVKKPTSLDGFWGPVLKQSSSLSVCIPVTSPEVITKSVPTSLKSLGIPSVGITDNSALVQVIHFLDLKNVKYYVKLLSFANTIVSNPPEASLTPSLAELRSGPILFIGNSDWSMRVVSPLRFHIHSDTNAGVFWIEDNQNLSSKKWMGKVDLPYADYTQDYAIISRIFDPITGQTVVAISGLGLHGTAAAAEFVTSQTDMNQVAEGDSPNWQKKNLQIVISTKIAGESWGPPYILAKYFW